MGTRVGYGGGGEKELPSFGAPSLAPRAFPLPSKARRLGVTGERKGKLRHRLAESWWPRPTPFHFRGAPPLRSGPALREFLASTSQAERPQAWRPRPSHSPGPRSVRAGRPPHSRTLDSRMSSCFWQRDLVPRGHTRRCADTGRLPPGSRTSRFCRIRLLASAAMAPREETPPNRQAPGARWAPPPLEKPARSPGHALDAPVPTHRPTRRT